MVDVGSIVTGTGNAAILVLWFLLFVIVGIFVYLYLSHNIKVRINDISKGNLFLTFDKGKISKDKRGKRYLSLLFSRRKIATPPSNCIKIGKRGKKYVDYYHTEDDAYLPVDDNFNFPAWKKANAELVKAHLNQVEEYDTTLPALEGVYCPVTSEERVVFIAELEAAEDYKKKGILDYLVQFSPYIAIIMILVIFVAFFGDVVKPIQEQGEQNAKILQATEKVLDRAVEIQDGRIEVLKGEIETQREEATEPPN